MTFICNSPVSWLGRCWPRCPDIFCASVYDWQEGEADRWCSGAFADSYRSAKRQFSYRIPQSIRAYRLIWDVWSFFGNVSEIVLFTLVLHFLVFPGPGRFVHFHKSEGRSTL